MKTQEKLNKYASCMEEIKKRTEVVRAFLDGRANALYEQTSMESICLQIRKILELIALSSLVANKEAYAKQKSSFANHYHAERIIKDIKSINANYYPKPTKKIVVSESPRLSESKPIESGYLTESELINIYERCGGLLHATNPFSNPKDIKGFNKLVPSWMDKIIKLLNHHEIHLADEKYILICIMNSKRAGKVQVTHFVPVEWPT